METICLRWFIDLFFSLNQMDRRGKSLWGESWTLWPKRKVKTKVSSFACYLHLWCRWAGGKKGCEGLYLVYLKRLLVRGQKQSACRNKQTAHLAESNNNPSQKWKRQRQDSSLNGKFLLQNFTAQTQTLSFNSRQHGFVRQMMHCFYRMYKT